MNVVFHADRIAISNYPFRACTLSRNFSLNPADIREVRSKRWPLEVVLASGEIIFLDTAHAASLELFSRVHALPQRYREDVWSLLCEPFLDTEFDAQHQERSLQSLAAAGFTPKEVDAIRQKIRAKMLLLNLYAMEWVHLSHYDVLTAHGAKSRFQWLFFASRQREFYDWCNGIANRAHETPAPCSDSISSLSGEIAAPENTRTEL